MSNILIIFFFIYSIIILLLSIILITKSGKPGIKGIKGVKGDKGPTGPNGDYSGQKGDTGPKGLTGKFGPDGDIGPIGNGSNKTIIYVGNFGGQKDPKWYYDNYNAKILYELIDLSFYDSSYRGYAVMTTYLPWYWTNYNDITQIYYGNNDKKPLIRTRLGKTNYTWTNWKTIIS